MDWQIATVTGVAGAILGVVGTAIVCYSKYKTAMAQARREDADVDLHNRKEVADFQAIEDERVVKQWEQFNEKLKEHYDTVIQSIYTEMKELRIESEKRREEHIKCQTENAVMKNQIAVLTEEKNQLRERVAALEKGR